jgi:hypothetical protein
MRTNWNTPNLICAQSGTVRRAFLSWSEREFDKLSSNKKKSAKWFQIGRNRQIYGVPVRTHGLYSNIFKNFGAIFESEKSRDKKM